MSKYDLNLNLIEESIKRIEADSNKSLEDETVWDAMLMRFRVIGENIDKLPREVTQKHEEINWRKFYSYRNTISHSYNKVLMEVIVDLMKELPILKRTIVKMRSELK